MRYNMINFWTRKVIWIHIGIWIFTDLPPDIDELTNGFGFGQQSTPLTQIKGRVHCNVAASHRSVEGKPVVGHVKAEQSKHCLVILYIHLCPKSTCCDTSRTAEIASGNALETDGAKTANTGSWRSRPIGTCILMVRNEVKNKQKKWKKRTKTWLVLATTVPPVGQQRFPVVQVKPTPHKPFTHTPDGVEPSRHVA